MPRIDLGDVAIEVPSAWEDRSTHCFALPPEALTRTPGVAPLTGGSPANVTLARLPVPDAFSDPVAYLNQALTDFASSTVAFTLHSVSRLDRGPAPGAVARYQLVTTEPIEQVRADLWLHDRILSLTGSSRAMCFDEFEPAFWSVFDSLRLPAV